MKMLFALLPPGSFVRRMLSFRVACFAILSTMLPGGAALAQQAAPAGPGMQVLRSHVRPVVANGEASRVGALPATQRMKLSITLPLRNQDELTALLTRLSDPNSPDYRHYLSVAEFTEQFGPTQQDYQAVVNFAQAHGFTVTQQHVNRLVVDIEGTAAQVEQAFHVNMNLYQHPTEDRTFFSPDREPSLDLNVPIWHIGGLNNFSIPRPMVTRAAAGEPIPFTAGSGPNGYFLGGDMRAAYYLSTVPEGVTPLTGTLENVGILEFDGYTPSDVTASFAGVPYTVPIQNVLLDGASASTDTINGDVEQVLDIVQVMAMAPGLNQIIVYIGPLLTDTASNDTDIFNRMATDNLAKELSVSWGWDPEDATADDPIFLEFAAQGQTVFVASGDFGAFVDAFPSYFPAEDPYVVTVGGTDLTTSGPGGSWVSETAWNKSGGGPSPDGFPMQPWQQGLANGSNQASETLRNAPDVAAEANNDNYTCGTSYSQFGVESNGCSGGWGGTSFAAPRWAGFMALANQQSRANGNSTVGNLAPVLYPLAVNPTTYANDFHDIVSGNNNDGWGVSWNAGTGYDMVTGLGSPKGQSLINALAGSLHATLTPATMSFTTQIVGTSSATQSATYTNISSTTSTLPAVVFGGINPSDFVLVSTGTSCPYTGGTVAASASCTIDVQFAPTQGGPREATVRAGNNYVSLSGTARLGAGIGTLAPTSLAYVNQLAATNAVLSATVTNTGTAAITFSSIVVSSGSAPNFSLVTTGSSCPYGGGSLAASASCTVDVQFAAPAASTATLTGSILLTDNIGVFNGVVGIAPSALVQTLSLSGNAILGPGVATLVPTSLDFGNQFVNGTYTKSSLLTNVGTVPIVLNSVTLSGTNMSDFPLITTGTSCPYSGGTVGVGASCTIDVKFLVPSAASSLLSASVALNDNIGRLNGSFSTLTQSLPISGQATSTYPIPSLSPSMQPLAAIPGSAGFTLTVSGVGFSAASIVQWNGSALTTTYISSTSISAAVPAGDIAAPGTASITVKNPTPGGGTSNAAYFVVTDPTAAVNYVNAPGSPFSPGGDGAPIVVAVGDWNHDGKPDLVVGNESPTGTGSVSFETLLNNGNGTFTAKATYVVVSNGNFAGVTAIVPGDFDGDGIPDLAVVEGSTGTVQLWSGNGDGTFTLKSTTAAGSGPTSAVAGDFNADGNLDLAVGNFSSNTISILLGNGNGAFTAAPTVNAPGSYDVNAMTVGDFNNDGILDLATACDDTCVVVFPGNNNGTFGPPIVTTAGAAYTGFFGIVAGDFNHDGNLDLAATNSNNIVEILLGKGDGTFTAGSTLTAGPFPTGLTLGDFNGDGILDLAATNSYNYQASNSASAISIYLGNGNGTFQPQVQVGAGDEPSSIAIGDFYGNGRLGLAVANSTNYGTVPTSVQVFVQQKITPAVTVTPGASTLSIAQMLAVTVTVSGGSGNAAPTGTVILSGGGYTSPATALSAGSATIDIPAGALSLGTDTLTAAYTPDSDSAPVYNGASGSAPVILTPVLITPTVTVTPGASSITTAQSDSVTVTVSGGNGNPTPTGSVTLSSGSYTSSPTTLSAGSANINVPAGQLGVGSDTLTATYAPDSGSSSTYTGATGTSPVTVTQAIGTCTTSNPNPNPNPQSFAAVGDFNGDCRSDILWRNSGTQQVYEWLMNGTTFPNSGSPGSLTSDWVIEGVGDFDGDGKSDVLWRNSTTGEVAIWLMNGATTTSSTSLGYVSADWVIQGVSDFNGDGKADILWRNSTTGQVYLWQMSGTTITGVGSVSYVSSDWVIQGLGDFNGDGMADILWRNSTTGQVYVWLMNGSTIASMGTPGSPTSDWSVAGVGDFDGNGTSDILWRNSTTGQVYLWFMSGTTFTSSGSVSYVSTDWVIEGVGDYDGSGRASLLWRNSNTQQVYIWLMNGTTLTGSGSPGTPDATWQIAASSP
ncbi:MAG: FG-GAP-like repeat-containing protein [Acidobacteriaceae bacterium]